MMAAHLLERQQDSTWAMQSPPVEVAANASALRSKLLTKPWEELLELGRDELPREVPDLRPQVLNPPDIMVVRIRRAGLDWPRYEFYGLIEVQVPVVEPEEPEEPEPRPPQSQPEPPPPPAPSPEPPPHPEPTPEPPPPQPEPEQPQEEQPTEEPSPPLAAEG